MKFSTKGRYATRGMLDLALHYGEGPVLLKDIARRQEIPARYLEQILIPLKRAGLVRSARGVRGGFMLSKPPSQIRLIDVIQLSEGLIALVECLSSAASCPRAELCATRDVWLEMEKAMRAVLESTSLQNLVERQRTKASPL